jgi:hypothetical protein
MRGRVRKRVRSWGWLSNGSAIGSRSRGRGVIILGFGVSH